MGTTPVTGEGVQGIDFTLPSLTEAPAMLVVEDQEEIRSLVGAMLKIRGHSCDGADSIARARELMSQKHYDILFLDVGLPDGSGLNIVEQEGRDPPLVVIITGTNDIETAIQAMRRGAFDFITKPFTVGFFLERTDKAVEEWKARRRYRYYERTLETLVKMKAEELSRTVKQIDQVHDMTVAALGAALDLKDHETEDHCKRVSENCFRLGKELQLSDFELKNLQWGAYLHDVGKIGIPERILLKEGGLNAQELRILRMHPSMGYEMVRNIEFLSYATDVVLYHHERFDGTGYLHGLKGTDIPLPARIFAVIDTLDAMTSDRPYRRAQPFERVVEEIKKFSGAHFDPDIARTFLGMPADGWLIQKRVAMTETPQASSSSDAAQIASD